MVVLLLTAVVQHWGPTGMLLVRELPGHLKAAVYLPDHIIDRS